MNEHTRIPESVLAMLRRAATQREAYAGNPDPLPIAEPAPPEDDLQLTQEELVDECCGYGETDMGLGERFRTRYGRIARHVTHVGWHGFDGMRFKEDASGAFTRQLAHKTAMWIDDEAIKLDCTAEEADKIAAGRAALEEQKKLGKKTKDWDADKLREFERLQQIIDAMNEVQEDRDGRMSSRHNFAKAACNTSRINNMLVEAQPYLSLAVDDLNRDLYAVNTRSGTLRFFRPEPKAPWTVRCDPHRAGDFLSKLAEVEFSREAACPSFERFLKRVLPDPDIRAFLQRFFGYSLLGITVEQCLLFFYGAGRNGKSTLVDLLCEILGDYAVAMSIDSFSGDSRRAGAEATPDLARLPGARLVAASEPEMGVNLKDALIKSLTGGEVISVRRLHEDFFELKPQFHIVLSGNHKPVIRDDSDGIWRRVLLVPFDVQIPEEEVDPELPAKLRREAAGVFGWLVRGCLDYLNGGLNVPDKIRAATAEYREESDPIGAFVRNACHVTGEDGHVEFPDAMYNAYCAYAAREGLPEFKKATFLKRLPDQTRKLWKSPEGEMKSFWKHKASISQYKGILIKGEFAGDSRPAGGYSPSMAADEETMPDFG